MEITHYQKTTRTIFPRMTFMRLVREVMGEVTKDDRDPPSRWTMSAIEALQAESENYLQKLMLCTYSLFYGIGLGIG
jgi:histone H3/H4